MGRVELGGSVKIIFAAIVAISYNAILYAMQELGVEKITAYGFVGYCSGLVCMAGLDMIDISKGRLNG